MFLPLFYHCFSHLFIRNFPAYPGSTLRSRALLEYLKMVTVANPITTTVTAISRAKCVGKQKRRNCLTSEVQRKCIRSWSLSVPDWTPGCDRLTKLVLKEKMCFSPRTLVCIKEGPCNRRPTSSAAVSWFSWRSGTQKIGMSELGEYHSALQSGENWASAPGAGQPYRACELLVLTKPWGAAFPSAGEWEEKQHRALGVVFSQR